MSKLLPDLPAHGVLDLFHVVQVRADSQADRIMRREPESAPSLWLCISAGRASCCTIQDPGSVAVVEMQPFPQLSL